MKLISCQKVGSANVWFGCEPSIDQTSGPIVLLRTIIDQSGMFPYHYHYPELGQDMDYTKLSCGTACTEDMHGYRSR